MEWTPLEEGMPTKDCTVLVYNNITDDRVKAIYDSERKVFLLTGSCCPGHNRLPLHVTHWFEIPKSPARSNEKTLSFYQRRNQENKGLEE